MLEINKINVFKDENGFTTLGVVVALLVSLSLIFSSAQVYRITSASADVQNVADSCSQAAENQVAEFMVLVRVADSVVLSLGVASLLGTALGIVTMCIPFTAPISDALLECSKKIFEARNSFAEKASHALNNIQKSLAFLASVKAYQIAKANNGGTFNANYLSVAILMPGKGVEIKPGNIDKVKKLSDEACNNSSDIKDAAAKAEEAAQKCNEAKLKAFMADCGNNPNYCMYERAKNKAYLSGVENPLYSSVDTWSFSVALKRCKAYYPKRLSIEKPDGNSVNAKSNSSLRKVFYEFASKQMQQAFVNENDDYFDAYFPHLPKNTDEMRQTSMYTDCIFPISNKDDKLCMHAYNECPGCSNVFSYGSIHQMENKNFDTCEYCKFRASSLGSVASASSSINNGYEYHYSIVENAAKEYKEAKENAKPYNNKVKNFVEQMFGKIQSLIADVFNKRIYAKPPGSYGTICLTVNTNSAPASNGFESSFVTSNSTIGIRAAISASTLIEENSEEGKTVINSILDGLGNNISCVSGATGIMINIWSKILTLYSDGQNALIKALEESLNQIPLVSASGLGTWSAKKITRFMQDLGLEPANLKALKPVLVNSFYVANKTANDSNTSFDGNNIKSFASKYLSIKNTALEISDSTNSLLTAISSKQELADILNLKEVIYDGGTIELATIEPIGDLGPQIPITIKLPQFAIGAMDNVLSSISVALQSVLGDLWGGKVWR